MRPGCCFSLSPDNSLGCAFAVWLFTAKTRIKIETAAACGNVCIKLWKNWPKQKGIPRHETLGYGHPMIDNEEFASYNKGLVSSLATSFSMVNPDNSRSRYLSVVTVDPSDSSNCQVVWWPYHQWPLLTMTYHDEPLWYWRLPGPNPDHRHIVHSSNWIRSEPPPRTRLLNLVLRPSKATSKKQQRKEALRTIHHSGDHLVWLSWKSSMTNTMYPNGWPSAYFLVEQQSLTPWKLWTTTATTHKLSWVGPDQLRKNVSNAQDSCATHAVL